MRRIRTAGVVIVAVLAAHLLGGGGVAVGWSRPAPVSGAAPTTSAEYPTADPVKSKAFGSQAGSAVAFDGINYLVVWTDDRFSTFGSEIFGARVSKAGDLLDHAGIPISRVAQQPRAARGGSPAVAFDGTNFLVSWTTGSDIYAARVSKAGVVLDSTGIPIATGDRDQTDPAVAFDGTNYFVSWTDLGYVGTLWAVSIYGARVSKAGAVLDEPVPIATATGDQSDPAMAFDGTNYLVVWTDQPSGHIVGARVSKAGAVLDRTGLPIGTADHVSQYQHAPAVAFDGTHYLVAWADVRVDGGVWLSAIYGVRVSKAGSLLDHPALPISSADVPDEQAAPAVSFDGTNYLVVWDGDPSDDLGGARGARISTAGGVVGGSDLRIPGSGNATGLVAAFDGTNYLVVWTDTGTEGPNSDIYGVRVSRTGDVLDRTGNLISAASNPQDTPALAFDGTNYLVVWTDRRAGSAVDSDIYGARISPTGAVLDGSGFRISAAANIQEDPAVVFDGTNYLVVWTDSRSGSDLTDVYGARISTAGAVLDGSGIRITDVPSPRSSYLRTAPAVAFDGTNYLVAWSDDRSNATYESSLFAARVSRAGHVLDPAGIPIATVSTLGEEHRTPAMAFDGTNYLVAWSVGSEFPFTYLPFDIRGARISKAGSVLERSGIAISTAVNDQTAPSVAFDGTRYLVVWTDARSGSSRDIYGARLSKEGVLQDMAGKPLSTGPRNQDAPTVVANGSFLVGWRDERRFRDSSDVVAVRVGGSTGVPGSAIAVSTDTDRKAQAAVAAGPGRTFGVVYPRVVLESPFGSSRVFLRTVAPK